MKKIILLPLLALILCSCSESEFYNKFDFDFGIHAHESYEVNDTRYAYEEEYFKMHGRYYYDETKQVMFHSFSAAGFEVTFKGTALEACFYTTNAHDNLNRPYIAVAVDNDYDPDNAIPIQLTSGTNSNSERKENGYSVHEKVTLVSGLEDKEHTIRVYKRSECLNSKVGFKSISTDGTILKVNSRDLSYKFEFFGDSVTCGYAVESPDFYENFSTRTENAMMTYANYASNELNADMSLISCGGYPMYKSLYSKNNNPDNIPEMFSLADVDWHTNNPHEWDNSKYIPDAVIIALGANDGSILKDYEVGSDKSNDFIGHYKNSYIDFIELILKTYGSDTLVVVSDEIIWLDDRIQNAMDEVVEHFNLPNVIRATYTAQQDAKDQVLPGSGHPNKEMQQIAGRQLAELLRSHLK